MEIQIRPIEQHEYKELADLGRSTFMQSFGNQNDLADMETYLSASFDPLQMASELKNPDSMFYFAEENQRIVGYMKVNLKGAQTESFPNSLEIERIYVQASHQGQNIGQILMNKATDIAISNHLAVIWLGVWDQNKDAIRFYKRNGFEIFDTHEFMLGTDQQTDVLMRKQV